MPPASLRALLGGAALAALLGLTGCAARAIEPGHRGLLFDPRRGLQREALGPGTYRLTGASRIDDFDVTYSTRHESLSVATAEGLVVEVKLAVIYRPIVAELYELDSQVGPAYYDEVIGPELRSAAREELATHSYVELLKTGAVMEDAIEGQARKRIAGRHVELSSVTLESVKMPPELVAAIREREIRDQNAANEKTERERQRARETLEAEEKWQKEKLELEHEVGRRRLQREAEGTTAPSR